MAEISKCKLFVFLLCLWHFDTTLSQRATIISRGQENYSNNNRGSKDINGNNGQHNDSNSSSNLESRRGHNIWIAGQTNCSCERELTALKKDLREEINQRQGLKAAVDSYMAELLELRHFISGNYSRKGQSPNAIAAAPTLATAVSFSTKLSYNRELKPLDTVVFDTVLTNDGNAYDPDSGKFSGPVGGTYLFHATILSGYNTKVETAIIVNDKEVARIYSGAHDAHGSGSNMAIVDLRRGDSVWVRLLYQGGNHVHGYYSTFSGALLRQSDV